MTAIYLFTKNKISINNLYQWPIFISEETISNVSSLFCLYNVNENVNLVSVPRGLLVLDFTTTANIEKLESNENTSNKFSKDNKFSVKLDNAIIATKPSNKNVPTSIWKNTLSEDLKDTGTSEELSLPKWVTLIEPMERIKVLLNGLRLSENIINNDNDDPRYYFDFDVNETVEYETLHSKTFNWNCTQSLAEDIKAIGNVFVSIGLVPPKRDTLIVFVDGNLYECIKTNLFSNADELFTMHRDRDTDICSFKNFYKIVDQRKNIFLIGTKIIKLAGSLKSQANQKNKIESKEYNTKSSQLEEKENKQSPVKRKFKSSILKLGKNVFDFEFSNEHGHNSDKKPFSQDFPLLSSEFFGFQSPSTPQENISIEVESTSLSPNFFFGDQLPTSSPNNCFLRTELTNSSPNNYCLGFKSPNTLSSNSCLAFEVPNTSTNHFLDFESTNSSMNSWFLEVESSSSVKKYSTNLKIESSTKCRSPSKKSCSNVRAQSGSPTKINSYELSNPFDFSRLIENDKYKYNSIMDSVHQIPYSKEENDSPCVGYSSISFKQSDQINEGVHIFGLTPTSHDKNVNASKSDFFLENEQEDASAAEEDELSSMATNTDGTSGGEYMLAQNIRSCPKDKSTACGLPASVDDELVNGLYSLSYSVLCQIGKGAFGSVKMSYRKLDGLITVTKFIKKSKVHKESWVDDARLNCKVPLEISVLMSLEHPNIVQVFAFFENENYFQLVMEKWGSGMDLFEFIDRTKKLDEPLASYIFRQMVSALQYLRSKGIVHRDIKDENIIINERFEIKLIDFGSAAFVAPNNLFSLFAGTVEYCSPEVLNGSKYSGFELEIWSLGVTLFTLLYGRNPFHDAEEIIKAELVFPHSLSYDFENLISGMLHKDPQKRYVLEVVASHIWTTQFFEIEDYDFDDIVECTEDEVNPIKYILNNSYRRFSCSNRSLNLIDPELNIKRRALSSGNLPADFDRQFTLSNGSTIDDNLSIDDLSFLDVSWDKIPPELLNMMVLSVCKSSDKFRFELPHCYENNELNNVHNILSLPNLRNRSYIATTASCSVESTITIDSESFYNSPITNNGSNSENYEESPEISDETEDSLSESNDLEDKSESLSNEHSSSFAEDIDSYCTSSCSSSYSINRNHSCNSNYMNSTSERSPDETTLAFTNKIFSAEDEICYSEDDTTSLSSNRESASTTTESNDSCYAGSSDQFTCTTDKKESTNKSSNATTQCSQCNFSSQNSNASNDCLTKSDSLEYLDNLELLPFEKEDSKSYLCKNDSVAGESERKTLGSTRLSSPVGFKLCQYSNSSYNTMDSASNGAVQSIDNHKKNIKNMINRNNEKL